MYKYIKLSYFAVLNQLLIVFLICSIPSKAMDVGMRMEEIQEPEFLRKIAHSIIARKSEQVRLQEKICKHDETIINVWKSGTPWGQLGQELQNQLTKHVPKSQVQSILRRDRHSQMSSAVIAHPEVTAEIIISKGEPKLEKYGQHNDQYAIVFTHDMSPTIMGTTFYKSESLPKPEEIPETITYVSFNVTELITKLLTKGVHAWNPEYDGDVTTLCIIDRKK